MFLFRRSVMSDSAITWTAARQASLPFTLSQSLLKFKLICIINLILKIIPHHRCDCHSHFTDKKLVQRYTASKGQLDLDSIV